MSADIEMVFSKLDINLPQFTQSEVVLVLNVQPTTLQNWANRGLIQLSESRPGRSQRRLYSASDVVKVKVMLELTSLGVSAGYAKDFADHIVPTCFRHMEEIRDYEKKTGKTVYGDGMEVRLYKVDGDFKFEGPFGFQESLHSAVRDYDLDRHVFIQVNMNSLIWSTLRGLLDLLLDEHGGDG